MYYPSVTHTKRTHTTKKIHSETLHNMHITELKLKKKKQLRKKSHSCLVSSHGDLLLLEVTQEAVTTFTWNFAHFHFSYVSRLAHEIEIFLPVPAPDHLALPHFHKKLTTEFKNPQNLESTNTT